MTARLSRANLDALPASVRRPSARVLASRTGIVHLGVGAFHRAHQAVFTEDAMVASGSDEWGIVGVTQRSPAVCRLLLPQDGLYTVVERGDGAADPRVIGAVRDVVSGSGDPGAVVARIADRDVRVVTLTVTEKGYRRGPDGRLDLDDPLVRADLRGDPPRSTVGQLVRGLEARSRADAGPLTVVCCDNLTSNGAVLRGLLEDFVAALPAAASDAVAGWTAENVRFPATMVDRIVPATTAADRREVRELLGVADEAVVVAERFRQWVITDDFAAARPRWELAGAVLTDDVTPWETAKIRLLNAGHSLLAYLGTLRGHDTIADAMGDDTLAAAVWALMRDDVVPTLRQPDGLDLDDYCRQVMVRFANPALRHRTTQVAMDGTQKLPVRVLGTIRDRLAAGVVPEPASMVVAGWMAYVRAAADGSSSLPLDDPLASRLRAAVTSSDRTAQQVDALLSLREVFGVDLPEHAVWRDLLVEQVDSVATGAAG